MNTPPEDATRVSASRLQQGVVALLTAAGLEASKAELLAGLLVANDLRGVVSHGSRQAATYAGLIAEGTLNGHPQVYCVAEQDATATFDGDGGLGYFPAYEAAQWVIEPARRYGVAVALTRNHGHFGAAGIYSRMVVAAGLTRLCHVRPPVAAHGGTISSGGGRWITDELRRACRQRTAAAARLRRHA